MKAIVKGYNQYTEEYFEYILEGVINVQYIKGTIVITRIPDNNDNVSVVNMYTLSSLDGDIIIY